jgi:hypothetical protein
MFYLVKAAVPHEAGQLDHQHGFDQFRQPESYVARLRDYEGRYPELHCRAGVIAGRKEYPRKCRGAGPDLDAADSLDDVRGCGRQIRQPGSVETSRAAGGARDGLRNARRSPFKLRFRRDNCCHRG